VLGHSGRQRKAHQVPPAWQTSFTFRYRSSAGIGVSITAPLVEVALGAKWMAVVPFVQALAVVAATEKILGYATWWFALSRGRTDVSLKLTVVKSLLLIVGILLGASLGPLGVAW
jgi:hypothetical protein